MARGGDVRYCDSRVPVGRHRGRAAHRAPWTDEEVEAADCVVMLTQHREFLEQPRWGRAKVVVDTRNVIPAAPNVRRI